MDKTEEHKSNTEPPPPCSQSQNEAEEDMVQTKNNSEPPPTCSQPQNQQEDVMHDSEFEESDKEGEYMPRRMNDPTTGQQGFHVTDLPTDHVDSDEYDSDYICNESSEDKDEPLGTNVRSGRRRVEFNEFVDMKDPKFVIGMIFPTCESFKGVFNSEIQGSEVTKE